MSAGAVMLLFRLEYKTNVFICHNVNTQNLKFARRPHFLASHRCVAFENFLHMDIAPVSRTLSGILHSKNYVQLLCSGQDTARYSISSAQEKSVSLAEPYTTDSYFSSRVFLLNLLPVL